jgi:hypothetical protein
LKLSSDGTTTEPTDLICAITSGKSFNATPVLFGRLQEFGKINKFTALRKLKYPTFVVSFADPQVASDVVDMMDGQYLTVSCQTGLVFGNLN